MAVDWKPSPSEVKAQIPQRINGGPFTATTIPTFDQVVTMIDNIAADIATHVGEPITDADHKALAKYANAVGAAAEVERTLFPEQSNRDGSNYADLRAEYLRLLERLTYVVTGVDPDLETLGGSFSHTFPAPVASDPATDDRWVPLSTQGF